MAKIFRDPIGGSDANNGTTFALRKKTLSACLSAASTNDEIASIASPKYKRVKSQASYNFGTWFYDKYFFERGTGDLSGDSTATKLYAEPFNHFDSATGWTASTNVTITNVGANAYKYAATSFAMAAGFAGGLCGYKAFSSSETILETLSVWLKYATNADASGTTFSIKLCSDTAGATPVYSFDIVGYNQTITGEQIFRAYVNDFGSALDFSTIQSIAVYCSTAGAKTIIIDNLIGTVSTSDPECITHNQVFWGSQDTYLTDSGYSQGSGANLLEADVKKNPLLFTVRFIQRDSSGGNHAVTVAYDTAANSTDTDTINTSGTSKSSHLNPSTTQTATYFYRYVSMMHDDNTATDSYAKNITLSGGWNRTDMSTQDDGDWTFQERRLGTSLRILSYGTTTTYTTNIDKMFLVREAIANTTPLIRIYNGQLGVLGIVNCIYPGGTTRVLELNTDLSTNVGSTGLTMKNTDACIFIAGAGKLNIGGTGQTIERIVYCNNRNSTSAWTAFQSSTMRNTKIKHWTALFINHELFSFSQLTDDNCYESLWGINASNSATCFIPTAGHTRIKNLVMRKQGATTSVGITSGNSNTSSYVIQVGRADIEQLNTQTLSVNTQVTQFLKTGIVIIDENLTSGSYENKTLHSHYYWIRQGTDTYSGSGKAWTLYPLNSTLTSARPAFFPIAKVAVKTGTTVTFKIRVKRSGTAIKAKLVCLGTNKFNDYTEVASSVTSASSGTWEQLTISPTISATGVAEIGLCFYDSTSENIIVDSFEVTS